jgi:hypothetical protein
MHRLLPREPLARRWLEQRSRMAAWVLLAAVVAFGLGVVADGAAGGRRINLLAPPFWGVALWNVLVYVVLLVAPDRRAAAAQAGAADSPWHGARHA